MGIHNVDRSSTSYTTNKNLKMLRVDLFQSINGAKLLALNKVVLYYRYLDEGVVDTELSLLNIWGITHDNGTKVLCCKIPLRCAKDFTGTNRSDWTNMVVSIDNKGCTGLIAEVEGIEKLERIEFDGIFKRVVVPVTSVGNGSCVWHSADTYGYYGSGAMVLSSDDYMAVSPMILANIGSEVQISPMILNEEWSLSTTEMILSSNVYNSAGVMVLSSDYGVHNSPMVLNSDEFYTIEGMVLSSEWHYPNTMMVLNDFVGVNVSPMVLNEEKFFSIEGMILNGDDSFYNSSMVINQEELT